MTPHLLPPSTVVPALAGPVFTDALTDRVNAWLSLALTMALIRPIEGTDTYSVMLPPFRKFFGAGTAESTAMAALRAQLGLWAENELCQGRELPIWETQIPEITPAMRRLVRLSNLRHDLRTRAAEWGGERRNLPAGALERCLVAIDHLVTRHAMQIPSTVKHA